MSKAKVLAVVLAAAVAVASLWVPGLDGIAAVLVQVVGSP